MRLLVLEKIRISQIRSNEIRIRTFSEGNFVREAYGSGMSKLGQTKNRFQANWYFQSEFSKKIWKK